MGLKKTDLLILRCTLGKEGKRTTWPQKRLRDFLGSKAAKVLRTGRRLAFKRPHTRLYPTFTRKALLDMYSGHLYPPAVKKLIRRELKRGVYMLILTGGYGLAHPQQRERRYDAHLPGATATVWRRRLPIVLHDFITRNGINRVFIACSRSYAGVLQSGTDKWAALVSIFWYTPRARQGKPRAEDIATQIAQAIRALVKSGKLDAQWTRGPNPDLT
jgi:hypothetical protein